MQLVLLSPVFLLGLVWRLVLVAYSNACACEGNNCASFKGFAIMLYEGA